MTKYKKKYTIKKSNILKMQKFLTKEKHNNNGK